MKNHSLFIYVISLLPFPLCIAHADEPYDLFYKVKYASSKEHNCFDILTKIKTNAKGEVVAIIPASEEINVKADPIQGKKTSTFYIKGQEIHVTAKKNSFVSFEYKACSRNTYRGAFSSTVEKDFFYFSPHNLFVMPIVSDMESEQMKTIKIDFTELPESFNFISNHGIDKAYTIKETLNRFHDNAFAATTSPLEKIHVKGNPIYILTKGKWAVFKEGLSSYVQKIITTQRTFWNDFDFPHYAIIFMEQNLPVQQHFIAGAHRRNMIAMSIPNSTRRNFKAATLATLSHEISHAWIGDKMSVRSPQGTLRLFWFLEGINDYYGLRFALESGVIDENSHIKIFNGALVEHYLSPYNSVSDSEMNDPYPDKAAHLKISTIRTKAHILFKTVAHYAQKENSPNPLDISMKKIYQEFKSKVVTEDRLHQIFSENFGRETWAQIRKKIEGEILDSPPQTLFKGKATLNKNSKRKMPDFGFDTTSLVKNKVIKNLNPQGNAYRAGLRENQEVIDYFVLFSAAEPRYSMVTIREGEKTKITEFLPDRLTTKEIPQYVLSNRFLQHNF